MIHITPRWLPAEAAARYVGVAETTFNRLVARGVFPPANRKMSDRLPRWDRIALDTALAGPEAAGVPSSDADIAFARLADDLAASSQRRAPRHKARSGRVR